MSSISASTYIVSGVVSGLAEVTLTHPIERWKVEMQYVRAAGHPPHLTNFFSLRNLYAGYLPRLVGVIPMRLTFWSSQSIANQYFQNHIIGGIIGGSCQSLIDTPIEVLKIHMMTKSQDKTSLIHILKRRAFLGFYPTLLRNSIFAVPISVCLGYKQPGKHWRNFSLGAFGGLIGCLITQPFDYVKTCIQSGNTVPWSNVTKNPMILMTGLIPRAISSVFNMGIGCVAFIGISDWCATHTTNFF